MSRDTIDGLIWPGTATRRNSPRTGDDPKMRIGESGWLRLGSVGGRAGEGRPRRSRSFRPSGADEGLEDRRLMSVQVTAADTLKIQTFPAPTVAVKGQDVTTGPDGNLWFTEPGVGKIGRTTPSGAVSEFPLPQGHEAAGAIIAGPDGNLWFTEADRVGRVTPAGVVTEFPVDPGAHLTGIAAASDGNIWFMDTDNHKIGRVTPGGVVTELPIPAATSLKSYGNVNLFHDLSAGPDGNLWYTAEKVNPRTGERVGEIGRVTPSGVVTLFTPPALPKARHSSLSFSYTTGGKITGTGPMLTEAITAGPDGNLWFTEHQANGLSRIGKITTAGKITQFPIPDTPKGSKTPDVATSITRGPDQNLWFNLAEDNFLTGPTPAPFVGRITTGGKARVFNLPSAPVTAKDSIGGLYALGAETITLGPDGKLWFTSTTRRPDSPTGRVLASFAP